MSFRISYCSLEEAWGDSFNRKDMIQPPPNNKLYQQQTKNNDKLFERNKYDKLIEGSDQDRENVISNMNIVERNVISENNSSNQQQFDKYRFNPNNVVTNNNIIDNEKAYLPFKENIEKKQIEDKLNLLENELKKYKYLMNDTNIESFSNSNGGSNEQKQSNSNDIIDLIILIIIGLLVIFVLNSIFNIGKAIGARNKI